MKIGILAIQGSVAEHKNALIKAAQNLHIDDFEVTEIRLPEDLVNSDGLSKIQGIILPGGESTTQSKLLRRYGLFDELKEKIQAVLPVWGTCAGAILLAKEVKGQPGKILPETFAVMDVSADRNAYGTQIDSFAENIEIKFPFKEDSLARTEQIEAVFIRAPKLTPLNQEVQILAIRKGETIALKQDNMLVTSFHPELTEDTSMHEFFISMCITNK